MKNKGFTLVELMIVVAIIGLLAAIAIPGIHNAMVNEKLEELNLTRVDVNSKIVFDPDTKEVVKVNDDYTEILDKVGKITCKIHVFKDISDDDARREYIEYYGVDHNGDHVAATVTEPQNLRTMEELLGKKEVEVKEVLPNEITINGTTYRKVQ